MTTDRLARWWAAFTVPALPAMAWDATGLDYPLARVAGGPEGFAARGHWLLQGVMHDGGRLLAWAAATALCLAIWWPIGPLRRLSLGRRLHCAFSVLGAVLAVSLLKHISSIHCPWDLSAFGGWVDPGQLSTSATDAGSAPGHCFPAGHATAGFAFLSGHFAFRGVDDRIARAWLCAALLFGTAFGLAQQWRGAHFMSHTLWSAVTCWWVALAGDVLRRAAERRWPHLDGTHDD